MRVLIVLILFCWSITSALPTTEKSLKSTDLEEQEQLSLTNIVGICFSKPEFLKCIKNHVVHSLDEAINDNSTWYINDYVTIERDINWQPRIYQIENKDLNAAFLTKLRDLAESRSLRMRMTSFVEEGRKKKDKKGKGGYMMGGLAVLAAHHFLGKLFVMSAVAFILAKVALIFSIVNALKKTHHISHGSDHVIYADNGGGSSGGTNSAYAQGWQRSINDFAHDTAYKNYIPSKETDDPINYRN